MEFTEGQPCWIDLTVPDAAAREGLMAFFGGLFGWTFEVGGAETGYYTMAMLDGAPVAAIGQQPQGNGFWITYLSVADIDAALARATAAGAQVLMGPMAVMGAGSMALGMDPAGAVFAVWQKADFAGFGAFWRANAPCWFDHQSSDPTIASAFYTSVFGLELHPAGPTGGGMLGHGESMVASVSTSPGDFPAYWNPVFAVASVDDAERHALDLGATVLMSRLPVPGGLASAFAAPGTGTVVTVFEAPEQAFS